MNQASTLTQVGECQSWENKCAERKLIQNLESDQIIIRGQFTHPNRKGIELSKTEKSETQGNA